MIPILKAEFRKLWTVRSTYFLFGFTFLITGPLLGLWAYGYKNVGTANMTPNALLDYLFAVVGVASVFLSIRTILHVGHEYRYNTITYSLTATNRRFKLFLAKWLSALGFSLVSATLTVLLGLVCLHIGWAWHGVHPMTQHVALGNFLLRSLVTVWGEVTYAFIIAVLVRNLIGAIVAVLVLPTTLENLLSLLLHGNVKYLPYTALGNITDTGSKVSLASGLTVVSAYVVAGMLVAYLLFQKRDAN